VSAVGQKDSIDQRVRAIAQDSNEMVIGREDWVVVGVEIEVWDAELFKERSHARYRIYISGVSYRWQFGELRFEFRINALQVRKRDDPHVVVKVNLFGILLNFQEPDLRKLTEAIFQISLVDPIVYVGKIRDVLE
jgi:hypothetical protein